MVTAGPHTAPPQPEKEGTTPAPQPEEDGGFADANQFEALSDDPAKSPKVKHTARKFREAKEKLAIGAKEAAAQARKNATIKKKEIAQQEAPKPIATKKSKATQDAPITPDSSLAVITKLANEIMAKDAKAKGKTLNPLTAADMAAALACAFTQTPPETPEEPPAGFPTFLTADYTPVINGQMQQPTATTAEQDKMEIDDGNDDNSSQDTPKVQNAEQPQKTNPPPR